MLAKKQVRHARYIRRICLECIELIMSESKP